MVFPFSSFLLAGLVALDALGIKVNRYYSSEIDADAIAVQRKRFFGRITEVGCVTRLDKAFLDSIAPIHLLLAGSPCDQLSRCNPKRKLFGTKKKKREKKKKKI